MQEARIFRKALLSRRVEEQLLQLYAQGKLSGTIHTCIGQEMIGAVLTEFLDERDVVFSGHRCHGYYLSHLGDCAGLVAELMGRSSGACGGWGGSQHLHRPGFFSNGILGGGAPIAAGVALARQRAAQGGLACIFVGDGAVGEGVIYETFNLAAQWRLPLLFVIEDNKIAQSTPQAQTLAGTLRARPEAFGIEVRQSSSWDWRELWSVAQESVQAVRSQGRPRALVVETARLKAHSKGDDTRDPEEIRQLEARDPLHRALQSGSLETLLEEVDGQVREAVELAERAPLANLPPLSAPPQPPRWRSAALPEGRLGHLLNAALGKALEQDERVFLLGEDIESPYGGAFKVTQGLSLRFPERVRNTPISEATLVGTGIGLALEGYRPFVEIMFGDFLTLAFDQLINHAAKFPQMYGGQVSVPLVVRTPMGGRRGYGPTHSQSLEKHFLGVPGLQVVALQLWVDPGQILQSLIEKSSGPTLLVENKLLYGQSVGRPLPQGFELVQSEEDFPVAWIRPSSGPVDLTLLGYGGMGELLLLASEVLFEEHERVCQVVLPSRIHPFQAAAYQGVWDRAAHLLVVEEGQGFASWGAEVVAQLATHGGPRCARLAAQPCCIAASPSMEREILPEVGHIVAAALELMR